jgi:hypothetical protein
LLVYDFDNETITNIVEAAGSDIRSTLNILQFFYSPVIMRPLYEQELSSEIFDVPLPKFEAPKTEVDVCYPAELQFEIYRSGLLNLELDNEILFDERGLIFSLC